MICARTAEAERADMLAYLARKIAQARKVEGSSAADHTHPEAMRRAWEIARDDLAAGLHEGEAALGDCPGGETQ